MRSRCLRFLCLALLISVCAVASQAQFELPNEIFQRTLLIRYKENQATGFKVDQAGRIYIVTTRHFAKELPSSDVNIQEWHQQEWINLPTTGIILPESKDVDLAMLERESTVRTKS